MNPNPLALSSFTTVPLEDEPGDGLRVGESTFLPERPCIIFLARSISEGPRWLMIGPFLLGGLLPAGGRLVFLAPHGSLPAAVPPLARLAASRAVSYTHLR